jgi:tetratricopeptide (TPR) repeat protein
MFFLPVGLELNLDKNDDSSYSFKTAADAEQSTKTKSGFKLDRKMVIILLFLVGIFGPIIYSFKAMVSYSAIAMAAADRIVKDNAAAMEHYNFAVETNPKSSVAYQYRGLLWSQIQQPEKAIADCTKAIEHGGDADCNMVRGSSYYSLGRLDSALKDYQVCAEKPGSDKAIAYIDIADAAFRLNDMKRSLAAANKAVELSPKEPVALLNRAQCLVCDHKYKKALADLNVAVDNLYRDRSNNSGGIRRDVYLTRAFANRALQKDEEASSDFSEARRGARVKHPSVGDARLFENSFNERSSRHYVTVCSNLTAEANAAYADRIESMLTMINSNVFHVRTDKTFRIFIFQSQAEFRKFAEEKKLFALTVADDDKGPMHTTAPYSEEFDSVFTYQPDDLNATMRSVIKKVSSDLPFSDEWSQWGMAELFKSVSGYAVPDAAELYLPSVIPPGSIPGSVPPLVEVINTSMPTNPAACKLALLYLLKAGKFPDYVKQVSNGSDAIYSTTFESVFKKRATEMERDWQDFVADLRKSASKPGQDQRGFIATSKESFQKNEKQLGPLRPLASIVLDHM